MKKILSALVALLVVAAGVAPVAAAPSIYGCGQVANGVLGFHTDDPGWYNTETGDRAPGAWMRWRIHGNGLDQVLYEGLMPIREFETEAYLWGLKDGKTYLIEYWEEIPGYGGFKGDIIICTAKGDSALPFGYDLTTDGSNASYPDEPASTPEPTPVPTPKPTSTPTTPPNNGGGGTSTPAPSAEPSAATPSESPAIIPSDTVSDGEIAVADTLVTPVALDTAPLDTATPAASGPYTLVLALIGGLIAVLLVAALRRRQTRR